MLFVIFLKWVSIYILLVSSVVFFIRSFKTLDSQFNVDVRLRLSGIYELLDDNPGFNPDEIINEFERSRAFTNLNNSQP